MREYFFNENGAVIVLNMIQIIQDNKEYLSEVDGAIGDGDHGVNMNKGFTLCKDRLVDKNVGLTEALSTLGRVLLMEVGGSMGPLYGTFFIEMSKVSKRSDRIDKKIFSEMLDSAVKGIQKIGNAKVGDKTLLDTLIPAFEAFNSSIVDGKSFDEAIKAFQYAAETGKESTRDLVAKIGRASRLGERSRGVLDAGAISCNLILQSMGDTMISLLHDN